MNLVEDHGASFQSVAATRATRITWSRVTRLVYAATFVWTIGFAVAAAVEQHLFLLRRYDLGNFTQAVWSAAHGHLFRVTEVGGAEVSRLGIHVDPIVAALVPLFYFAVLFLCFCWGICGL